MTQGERIRQCREGAGLSRFEAATKMTEAGRPTREHDFYRWESDRNQPDAKALTVLCQIINCSSDFILGLSMTPRHARPVRQRQATTTAAA